MKKVVTNQLTYYNGLVNKRKLQELLYQIFQNYGVLESSLIADKVKNLTFHYATISGISLNAEDLRVPYQKRRLIGFTSAEVEIAEQKYESGDITNVERFQKVIDIWNNASNTLKNEVIKYFRESDPLNPLYIMAFSGARGNISQVRQLVGMRGLMADPQGQIIDLPIKSNFREGLKVTEYVISSYGARKGLVDTALRTADSGYLTRRLVDIAQDIIVRDEDCLTQHALSYEDLFQRYETQVSFKEKLLGRLIAKDLLNTDGSVAIKSGTAMTLELIESYKDLFIGNLLIRSPLTCDFSRSVCRKCYGWHLSYSRLVDLGEAVGIVAAQSIGEPGTQLTMRTFHTGGVFSGDLTQQIRAPFPGTIVYNLHLKTKFVRTMHGERGFQLSEMLDLHLKNKSGVCVTLIIPKGNILLVNNKQKVYTGQILAEIKKNANLIIEEDSKQISTEASGEVFLQNIKPEHLVNKQGGHNTIAKTSGLIWVLNSEQYSLPKSTKLEVEIGKSVLPQTVLATYPLVNYATGIVKFDRILNEQRLKVLTSAIKFKNVEFVTENKDTMLYVRSNSCMKEFRLLITPRDYLIHNQKIAVLKDNQYNTQTGGIVFYELSSQGLDGQSSISRKYFSGSLYWIEEETHTLSNLAFAQLLVKPNQMVKRGTELWPGTYSNSEGFVSCDEIKQEISIKPGELFLLSASFKDKKKFSQPRFIRPGETIVEHIMAEKLVYCECITAKTNSYLLVRPVQIFKVPREKGFRLRTSNFTTLEKPKANIKTVKRIFFKNGEQIKSNTGINLLDTVLVLQIEGSKANIRAQLELREGRELRLQGEYKTETRILLYETFTNDDNCLNRTSPNLYFSKNYLVQENQFISSNSFIAQVQITLKRESKVVNFIETNENTKELMLIKQEDIKAISWTPEKESSYVKVGDLVRANCQVTTNSNAPCSGQIYSISNEQILIRKGRPYLISEGTILRVKNKSLVQRSDILATLVYKKLKTIDIVQGLPRIEEILEARKIEHSCLLAPCGGQVYIKKNTLEIIEPNGDIQSVEIERSTNLKVNNGDVINLGSPLTDGQINPHKFLEVLFNYYRNKLAVAEACRISFKHLQLFLVNEVQRTYFAQGVNIADKHIEVIVKQMTSKVQVKEGGDTTLLPGEVLSLSQATQLTNALQKTTNNLPFYVPVLLGLTKASLNSDSFISAASFQETTRVLTEAAIEGKKDWLIGLKENVIIGRLIPAGTGFNYSKHIQKLYNRSLLVSSTTDNNSIKNKVLETRLNGELI